MRIALAELPPQPQAEQDRPQVDERQHAQALQHMQFEHRRFITGDACVGRIIGDAVHAHSLPLEQTVVARPRRSLRAQIDPRAARSSARVTVI